MIKEKRVYTERDQWGQPLSEYLAGQILHGEEEDYGRNSIEEQIKRNALSTGRLLSLLNAKGIISDEDVLEIAGTARIDQMDIESIKFSEDEL